MDGEQVPRMTQQVAHWLALLVTDSEESGMLVVGRCHDSDDVLNDEKLPGADEPRERRRKRLKVQE